MMPMTPMGTRTREISRPLGRVHQAEVSPTGSGSAAMSSSLFRHGVEAGRVKFQRSTSARLRPAATARALVGGVGGQDRPGSPAQLSCHGGERLVLLLRPGQRQHLLGSTGRTARAPAGPGIIASSAMSAGPQHQVIAVNDLIAAVEPEYTGDAPRISAR